MTFFVTGSAHMGTYLWGHLQGHLTISSSARAVYFQPGTHFCGTFLSATTFSLLGVVRYNLKQRVMQMLTLGVLLNSEVAN